MVAPSIPFEFNTAGPNMPDIHYTLPPLARVKLDEVMALIQARRYFILHAPRQTGKTSCLLALRDHLNREGRYRCLYVNIEAAQAQREDVREAVRSILSSYAQRVWEAFGDAWCKESWHKLWLDTGAAALEGLLAEHAARDPRPLVVLFDEVDALIGDTLISFLRQLRAGYDKRPAHFPQTVVLCGVRDVRDYRIHSSAEKTVITGGSAFNVKAESLRLGDFSRAEMEALYAQHTVETGQVFEPAALDCAWELTRGQPWLVNALAREACFKIPAGKDRSRPVTAELLELAKENLIERRDTHLDQLSARLEEDRVRRVIEPILDGADLSADALPNDDVLYVRDLGLIRIEGGTLRVANALYQEIIPRELTWTTQYTLTQEYAWYQRADGSLDVAKLLLAFQEFFREHSEHWVERFQYKEAGPQLLLQAFLQRIVNGGGRIEREYGLGRRRTDLLILWPLVKPLQKVVLELKLIRNAPERALADGLAQTVEYLDRCGAAEGHLILFDRRPQRTWEEKLFCRQEQHAARSITVWGM